MYIEKRWLVPAALSLLLASALLAVALLVLGSRFLQAAHSLSPTGIARIEAGSRALGTVTQQAPVAAAQPSDPSMPGAVSPVVPADVPAVTPARRAPAALGEGRPASPSPEEVVGIDTSGSGATQINTRGFGDIGLQFQDVVLNGPVTMVHVSNQGNNNSTSINTGANDRITSNQQHLQSNRSDAGPRQTTAPTAPRSPGSRARSHR